MNLLTWYSGEKPIISTPRRSLRLENNDLEDRLSYMKTLCLKNLSPNQVFKLTLSLIMVTYTPLQFTLEMRHIFSL